jgi:hypothetical protein
MKKQIIKSIAILINLIFTVTSTVGASPHSVYSVKTPAEFGKIKERWKNANQEDNKPVVVHIQDAHSSFEAQENIARLIGYFVNEESRGVNQDGDDKELASLPRESPVVQENLSNQKLLVCAEGASGECDTSLFSSYPNADVREYVARTFMKRGKFTGSEYQSIVSAEGFDLFGAEERPLYRENYEAYLAVLDKRDDILGSIEALESILVGLKENLFSDEARLFLNDMDAYKENRKNFIEHIHDLITAAHETGQELVRFINLSLFFEAMQKESGVTKEACEQEAKTLVAAVSAKGESADWHAQYAAGALNEKEYYVYLKGLIFKYGLDESVFQNIVRHSAHLEKMNQVDVGRLIYEARELRWIIEKNLARSTMEKEIVMLSQSIELLKILVRLEAVSEDVRYFFENREFFKDDALQYALRNVCGKEYTQLINAFRINQVMREVERFYEKAEARNTVLVENALSEYAHGKNVSDIILLISGGYHSEGITETLREKDIPYVVVTPHINTLTSDIPYEERMLLKLTPFENIIMNPAVNTISFQLMSAKEPLIQWARDLNVPLDAKSLSVDLQKTHEKSVLTALYIIGFVHFVIGESAFHAPSEIGERFMNRFALNRDAEREFREFLRQADWLPLEALQSEISFNYDESTNAILQFIINGSPVNLDVQKLFASDFDASLARVASQRVLGELTARELTALYQTILNFYTIAHPAQVSGMRSEEALSEEDVASEEPSSEVTKAETPKNNFGLLIVRTLLTFIMFMLFSTNIAHSAGLSLSQYADSLQKQGLIKSHVSMAKGTEHIGTFKDGSGEIVKRLLAPKAEKVGFIVEIVKKGKVEELVLKKPTKTVAATMPVIEATQRKIVKKTPKVAQKAKVATIGLDATTKIIEEPSDDFFRDAQAQLPTLNSVKKKGKNVYVSQAKGEKNIFRLPITEMEAFAKSIDLPPRFYEYILKRENGFGNVSEVDGVLTITKDLLTVSGGNAVGIGQVKLIALDEILRWTSVVTPQTLEYMHNEIDELKGALRDAELAQDARELKKLKESLAASLLKKKYYEANAATVRNIPSVFYTDYDGKDLTDTVYQLEGDAAKALNGKVVSAAQHELLTNPAWNWRVGMMYWSLMVNQTRYQIELGKLVPDHPEAIDGNTNALIATLVKYNWGPSNTNRFLVDKKMSYHEFIDFLMNTEALSDPCIYFAGVLNGGAWAKDVPSINGAFYILDPNITDEQKMSYERNMINEIALKLFINESHIRAKQLKNKKGENFKREALLIKRMIKICETSKTFQEVVDRMQTEHNEDIKTTYQYQVVAEVEKRLKEIPDLFEAATELAKNRYGERYNNVDSFLATAESGEKPDGEDSLASARALNLLGNLDRAAREAHERLIAKSGAIMQDAGIEEETKGDAEAEPAVSEFSSFEELRAQIHAESKDEEKSSSLFKILVSLSVTGVFGFFLVWVKGKIKMMRQRSMAKKIKIHQTPYLESLKNQKVAGRSTGWFSSLVGAKASKNIKKGPRFRSIMLLPFGLIGLMPDFARAATEATVAVSGMLGIDIGIMASGLAALAYISSLGYERFVGDKEPWQPGFSSELFAQRDYERFIDLNDDLKEKIALAFPGFSAHDFTVRVSNDDPYAQSDDEVLIVSLGVVLQSRTDPSIVKHVTIMRSIIQQIYDRDGESELLEAGARIIIQNHESNHFKVWGGIPEGMRTDFKKWEASSVKAALYAHMCNASFHYLALRGYEYAALRKDSYLDMMLPLVKAHLREEKSALYNVMNQNETGERKKRIYRAQYDGDSVASYDVYKVFLNQFPIVEKVPTSWRNAPEKISQLQGLIDEKLDGRAQNDELQGEMPRAYSVVCAPSAAVGENSLTITMKYSEAGRESARDIGIIGLRILEDDEASVVVDLILFASAFELPDLSDFLDDVLEGVTLFLSAHKKERLLISTRKDDASTDVILESVSRALGNEYSDIETLFYRYDLRYTAEVASWQKKPIVGSYGLRTYVFDLTEMQGDDSLSNRQEKSAYLLTDSLELNDVLFEASDFLNAENVFEFIEAELDDNQREALKRALMKRFGTDTISPEDIRVEFSREAFLSSLRDTDAIMISVSVRETPLVEFYLTQVYESSTSNTEDDIPLRVLRLENWKSYIENFGIGTFLLGELIDVLKRKGYESLILDPNERTRSILEDSERGLDMTLITRSDRYAEVYEADSDTMRLYVNESIGADTPHIVTLFSVEELSLRDALYVFINFETVSPETLIGFEVQDTMKPIFYSFSKTTAEIVSELGLLGLREDTFQAFGSDTPQIARGKNPAQSVQNVIDACAPLASPENLIMIDREGDRTTRQDAWKGVVDPTFQFRDINAIEMLALKAQHASTIMTHINFFMNEVRQGLLPSVVNGVRGAFVDIDNEKQRELLKVIAEIKALSTELLTSEELMLLQSLMIEEYKKVKGAPTAEEPDRAITDIAGAREGESFSPVSFVGDLWRAPDFKKNIETAFRTLFDDVAKNIPLSKDRVRLEHEIQERLKKELRISENLSFDELLSFMKNRLTVDVTIRENAFTVQVIYNKGEADQKVIGGLDNVTQLSQFRGIQDDDSIDREEIDAVFLDFFYSHIEDIGIGTSLLRIFFREMYALGINEVIMYPKTKTREILERDFFVVGPFARSTERLELDGERYYKHHIESAEARSVLEDEAAETFTAAQDGTLIPQWRMADISMDLKHMLSARAEELQPGAAGVTVLPLSRENTKPLYLFIDIDSFVNKDGELSDVAKDFDRDFIERIQAEGTREIIFFSYDKTEDEMKTILNATRVGDREHFRFIGKLLRSAATSFKESILTDAQVAAFQFDFKDDFSNAIIINANLKRDNPIHAKLTDGRVSDEAFGLIGIVDPHMARDANFEARVRTGEFVPTIAGHIELFLALGAGEADFSIDQLGETERFHNVVIIMSEEMKAVMSAKIAELKREKQVKTAA